MDICYIAVHNRSLKEPDFQALCDYLKRYRQLASDYRMNRDFDKTKDTPWWHSKSYLASETLLINNTLDTVRGDIVEFCQQHKLNRTDVQADIVTISGDE